MKNELIKTEKALDWLDRSGNEAITENIIQQIKYKLLIQEKNNANLYNALLQLLDFCISGRRYKSMNPYAIDEIKNALEIVAKIQGKSDYLNCDIPKKE